MKKALIFCLIILLSLAPAFAADGYFSASIGISTNARPVGTPYSEKTVYYSSRDESQLYSYEGHSILIYDGSTYHLGSTEGLSSFNTPEEASRQGYITTSWSGNYSSSSNKTYTNGNLMKQNVVYNSPTADSIILSSTWIKGNKTGESKSSSLNLEIRPCPFFDSFILSGEQRAFRKQTLTVYIAVNPNYPIKDVKLSIPGAECSSLKTESIEGGKYIKASLDFITKNSTTTVIPFSVSAKDSRGKTLNQTDSFTVLGDKDPIALIDMGYRYFRDGNGIATVVASSNGAITDDPVKCFFKATDSSGKEYEGYDASMGLGLASSFNFTVPGNYQMQLTVKDDWELNEFAKESDKKEATYTRNFVVDNTAPKVSLLGSESASQEPINLGLVLLNYDDDPEELNSYLRERGIIAHITSERAATHSEDLSLIATLKNANLDTLISGKTNKLVANADGKYPVYNASGEIRYLITTGTRSKAFKIESLDGKTVYTGEEMTDGEKRLPFGLEFSDGNMLLVFPGYSGKVTYTYTVDVKKGTVTKDDPSRLPCSGTNGAIFYDNTVIVSDVNSRTKAVTAYVMDFNEMYDAKVERLKKECFKDEYDINLLIDASKEDVLDVIEKQCGSSSSSASSSSTASSFTFSYSDIEGDPMKKAYYSYNGITYETDSLSISISPVKGENELKFWAIDSCGNSEFDRKSNVITIKIDGGEEIDDPEEPVIPGVLPSLFRLHRRK